MTDWNGKERREMTSEDHDLLIGISGDVKHIVSKMNEHIIEDKVSFAKIRNEIGWLQKIIFMGLGAIAFLKWVIK